MSEGNQTSTGCMERSARHGGLECRPCCKGWRAPQTAATLLSPDSEVASERARQWIHAHRLADGHPDVDEPQPCEKRCRAPLDRRGPPELATKDLSPNGKHSYASDGAGGEDAHTKSQSARLHHEAHFAVANL